MRNRDLVRLITDGLIKKCENYSFSQEGEDVIIRNLIGDKTDGVYVDIGSYHPIRYSNTFWLYSRGWHGINIDATPGKMKLFDKYRKRDINIQVGIARQSGEMKYYEFDEGALDTFDEEIAKQYIAEGWKLKRCEMIQTWNINDVLDKYLCNQEIDLIDIDVEGLDNLIVDSLDWERYKPNIVLTERLDVNSEDACKINEILVQKGYRLVATTLRTGIYVQKSDLR